MLYLRSKLMGGGRFGYMGVYLLMILVVAAVGLGEEASVYDRIWGWGKLYENSEDPVVQDVSLSGRLQADAVMYEADQGRYEDVAWRRFRFGFKTRLFQDVTVHAEADLDLNQLHIDHLDRTYKKLTDAYVGWSQNPIFVLKVGKQSAPFTLDGATSSKKLITLERSVVADNLWFSKEYFTGVTGAGQLQRWTYRAGLFSARDARELGHFDSGAFTLVSVGRVWDAASVRFDYVYNDPDYSGKVGTQDLRNIASLVSKLKWQDVGLWMDLSWGEGINNQSDLLGLQVMPFVDFTEQVQGVFRYAMVDSCGGIGSQLTRYPRKIDSRLAETVHDFFLGINLYLYGHKLKWQNGVDYTYARNMAGTGDVYRGWGFTSGLRLSW